MANGKKKETKGKKSTKTNTGTYFAKQAKISTKARENTSEATREATPERKRVRELQGLKNKKASKAAKAQLRATSAKTQASAYGVKKTRGKAMKRASKLQDKADRKYKRVTGKSPVQKHCTPVKMNAPITTRVKR